MKLDWIEALQPFGARKDDVVILNQGNDPSILPYLDLVDQRSQQLEPMPEAVVQIQRQPLLYLYSEAQLANTPNTRDPLPRIKQLMTMRGDAALIGIFRPGILQLHSSISDPKQRNKSIEIKQDVEGQWLIPRLAQGNSPLLFSDKFIETELFRLLEDSAKQLRLAELPVVAIVSLTGRALFLRFLLDRNILQRGQAAPFLYSGSCLPEDAFASPESAAATCRWLDQTFNGDLLPLPDRNSEAYFSSLGQSKHSDQIFSALQAILSFDDPLGNGAYQKRLDWDHLHLAHVPVGLLSQVYERYMEMFYPKIRKETSAYYTPRHLAEIMVDEAFYGLDQAHLAKVLDPAAGAGVFLVAAFHKLVEERWRHDGKRPNRDMLRQILNQQIRGFDINSHALKLSALSLYLTRLELDPDPTPLDDLSFEALQGKVLYDWSSQEIRTGDDQNEILKPTSGSLGEQVGEEHKAAYDVVIGNPPWSAHSKGNKELIKVYTTVSRRVAMERGVPEAATYVNPDGVPDLPFLWRSMEWARPGGRIALALHGRWLFKQSPKGIQSRKAILKALNVTGVLNGAALRNTKVWPNMDHPFCLLFAQNRLPNAQSGFFFVSPKLEPLLNREGKLRIDAQAAEPVLNNEAANKPWLLKSLFRGNRLGAEVISKVLSLSLPTIEQYWQQHGLALGEGYQTTASGSYDSDFLLGRLDVPASYCAHPFLVKPQALKKFGREKVYRRKEIEIYQSPLLLIRDGIRYNPNRGRALLVQKTDEIVYSESYVGLSCFGHPASEQLSKYIFLLFHSKFHLFFQLLTTSQFGVERDALLPENIRNFPFAELEKLSSETLEQINRLVTRTIQNPTSPPWPEIDALIDEIYGLNRWDRQVIEDTLTTCLPDGTAEARQAAKPATQEQKQSFKNTLLNSMEPFFSVTGRSVDVCLCENKAETPWIFIEINTTKQSGPFAVDLSTEVLAKADDLMVSRIIQTNEECPGCLRIGILDQARYWTSTEARLLSADILRNYGHQLEQGN